MASRPSVLVLDDGELGDVRAALEEIGAPYTYLRGGAVEGIELQMPRDLLVASGRRALLPALEGGPSAEPDARPGRGDGPVRIAVVSEDSNALRAQLRRVGFHYLVRQPVHPAALRLLLLRALYRGPERRVAVRYPIGGRASYRTGLRRRPATLVEIALRGCRLYSEWAAEPEARITVFLSKEFTGGKKLVLPGWVLRCELAEGKGPEFEIAVAFDTLKNSREHMLREVLKSKLYALEAIAGDEAERGGPDSAAGETGDRRGGRRGAYRRHVLAIENRAQRVLVGRNLSSGGMLVEQNLELQVGNAVRLAIFGRQGEDPILVRARVLREDENGMALEFTEVSQPDRTRLENLVARLPSVERLADGEADALGTVMAEIVPDGRAGEVL